MPTQQHKAINTLKTHLGDFIALSLFATLLYYPYFIFYERIPGPDWDYFNALSYSIDLSIFKYHQLPLHDPYICGGADILANPQSYVFSPSILLNFIFNPYWSNVVSLIVFATAGGLGMIKLLKYFGVERRLHLIGAMIFLSGNWFTFHFAAGHLVFRSFYLTPWAIYLIFNLAKNIKYILYFSLLMAFFQLDGGIYSFNFCLFFLLIAICCKKPSLEELLNLVKNNKQKCFFITLAFLLLIIPKIIPVILINMRRKIEIHTFSYSLRDIWFAFFYPLNTLNDAKTIKDHDWGIHDYVCYIGALWTIPATLLLIKKRELSNYKTPLALMLICLWIGIGLGGLFNPWTVFIVLPIIHHSHLQSRFLIFFWVFFIVMLCKILEKSENKKLWAYLILLEISISSLAPLITGFIKDSYDSSYRNLKNLEPKNITKTITLIEKPYIYFTSKSSKLCYDKAQPRSVAAASDDKGYIGESYSINGNGKLIIKERVPGKITASYDGIGNETFVLNTNYLAGWESFDKNAYQVTKLDNLVILKIKQPKTEIIVFYKPKYLHFILGSFLSGIVLYIILFTRLHDKK